MERINTKELTDYLYCPEFWWTKKKNSEYEIDLDIQSQRKRYEKRKKQYEFYLKLQKEIEAKKKGQKKNKPKQKARKRKKQGDWIVFLGILVCAMFFLRSYLLYIVLGGMLVWLLYWLISHWKQWTVKYLKRQLDPYTILKKEKKINPQLILYDFSNSPRIFGELNVIYQENHFHIILNRSNSDLPSFLRLAKKSDLIELASCMKIFHTHFFTNKIVGQIRYQNETKTIKWINRKNEQTEKIKTLLSEIDVISNLIQGGHKKTKPLPYRCEVCKFASECTSFKTYPQFRPTGSEHVEKTYERFLQAASQLLSTSKKHWQNDAKELFKIISSSSTIQEIIKKHCTSERFFDIEENIFTATFHKMRLFNTLLSLTDELTFSYKLLQYIAEKGKSFKQSTMERLSRSYGLTKGYDFKTDSDTTVRRFFNSVFGRLISVIDIDLQKYIPPDTAKQIQFNLNHSQLNIANDNSIINAVMEVDYDDNIDDEDEDE